MQLTASQQSSLSRLFDDEGILEFLSAFLEHSAAEIKDKVYRAALKRDENAHGLAHQAQSLQRVMDELRSLLEQQGREEGVEEWR